MSQDKKQSIDPEVVPKAERWQYTAEYKRRILQEYEACTELGGRGAYLRREGFRRIQKLSAEIVYLGNSVANTAGNHLFESVEMPVFDQEYLWSKEL